MSGQAAEIDWLRLDNAAKIYPAAHSDAAPAVFRVSVTLNEPVRVRELQTALDRMVERTPYYQVHLRRGFFWYYLQRHGEPVRVQPMPEGPLANIPLHHQRAQLFRVSAREATVAVDFSHVLTDGYGAMRFLSSLIVEYLRQLGEDVDPGSALMDPNEEIPEDEYEDAFQALYRQGVPKEANFEPAYHVNGIPHARGYRVITGRMPVQQALATAKRYSATLTEYLVAVYMQAIKGVYEQQMEGIFKPGRRIIRIEVPVNMRRLVPSETMRNFSLFVSPSIDLRLGTWSFEQIVRRVHNEMNIQLDPNELARQIARNVGGERNRFIRVLPRFVKYAFLGHVNRTVGESSYSGVVSNLGRFLLPESVKPFVRAVGFLLGPNHAYKTCCSVVSYGDELFTSFGSVIQNRAVERNVFRKLADDGMDVVVTEQVS